MQMLKFLEGEIQAGGGKSQGGPTFVWNPDVDSKFFKIYSLWNIFTWKVREQKRLFALVINHTYILCDGSLYKNIKEHSTFAVPSPPLHETKHSFTVQIVKGNCMLVFTDVYDERDNCIARVERNYLLITYQ